ncbi:MAG TPA: Hsp20/alpha crystallin family protein [Symbiobacteriaceae bacterium]|jgi:HSP20 family molecular chaperone IbpA|nr:Hsp20/alpha crystallin family protein [Symbiobacteriaceae bacterium]
MTATNPTDGRPTLAPPVDVLREGDYIKLIVSVPGVRSDQLRIAMIGNRQLQIDGTVPYRHPIARELLAQAELPDGAFARTVDLPIPCAVEGATVDLRDGLLTIRLPLQHKPVPLTWESGMGGGNAAEPR